MNEELTPQKEQFLQEVERKLLRRELDAKLLEDGMIHIKWNEKPLCSIGVPHSGHSLTGVSV